jgi:hypothetical protein
VEKEGNSLKKKLGEKYKLGTVFEGKIICSEKVQIFFDLKEK